MCLSQCGLAPEEQSSFQTQNLIPFHAWDGEGSQSATDWLEEAGDGFLTTGEGLSAPVGGGLTMTATVLQRRHCADPGGRKLEAEGNINHQKEHVSNKVHWPLHLSCFILRTRADQLLERSLLSREAMALPSAELAPLRKQTLSYRSCSVLAFLGTCSPDFRLPF